MKKIIFLIVLFAIGFTSLQAQKEITASKKFTKDVGDQFIQVQVLNFFDDFVPEGDNIDNNLVVPVMLDASYFYRIANKVDVGPMFGFASYSTDELNPTDYTYYFMALRGFYNLVDGSNLDMRAGLTMGYRIESRSKSSAGITNNASDGGVAWGIHLNTRYFFTENLGASLELGYGMRVVSLGLAYKL